MPPEDGFLHDIGDHPDDDTPRLVYADWLEEHGGPGGEARAEVIRVQCTLARLDEADDRRWELEARERRLLRAHGKHWAGPLRPLVRRWRFRRGFVEDVTLRAEDFLRRAPELFARHPVRRVRFLGAA